MAKFKVEAKKCRDKIKAQALLKGALLPMLGTKKEEPAPESRTELESMLALVTNNLECFENDNLLRMQTLADKVKLSYDVEKQTAIEEIRKQERLESRKANSDCFATQHIWTVDSSDSAVLRSYSPAFLRDLQEHFEDYMSRKDVLDNLAYESTVETEYLKRIESNHLAKTTQESKRLLEALVSSTPTLGNITQNQNLQLERTLKDDDAECAICSSGDYEDNDNIVFCEFCGISVHQSCYGIEVVPEGDWFCVSCTVMGKLRARNLKCCLCPKYGGAMRPTTILSQDPLFVKYETTFVKEIDEEVVLKK
jgi:hypothetical protein